LVLHSWRVMHRKLFESQSLDGTHCSAYTSANTDVREPNCSSLAHCSTPISHIHQNPSVYTFWIILFTNRQVFYKQTNTQRMAKCSRNFVQASRLVERNSAWGINPVQCSTVQFLCCEVVNKSLYQPRNDRRHRTVCVLAQSCYRHIRVCRPIYCVRGPIDQIILSTWQPDPRVGWRVLFRIDCKITCRFAIIKTRVRQDVAARPAAVIGTIKSANR